MTSDFGVQGDTISVLFTCGMPTTPILSFRQKVLLPGRPERLVDFAEKICAQAQPKTFSDTVGWWMLVLG